MAVLAYWGLEAAQMTWEGIPVFPRSRHPASQDFMVPLARQLHADGIVVITDPWTIETPRFQGTDVAYIPWFPVDGEPMDTENARGVAGPGPAVTLPIATSDHAEAMARVRGITDVRTIPYMVDTDVYCPGDQVEARRAWGIPEGAFVVGMVAMNKLAAGVDRKCFEQQIAAFARLRAAHDDAVLYLHTHVMAPDGLMLQALVERYDVPRESVMFTDGLVLTVGATPEMMANLYRAFDVVTLVSGGEGAGMPLLEAAACGVPSIHGGWTAMPQYAKSGWRVDRSEAEPRMNAGRAWWHFPHVSALHDRMEQAYVAGAQVRAEMGAAGREGALAHAPAAVWPLWEAALAEVEARRADLQRVTSVEIPEVLLPAAAEAAA
ncbi:MAG: glycosyltransferase [Thermoleophilia bacterium]